MNYLKKLFLTQLFLFFTIYQATSQPGDDVNGRLWWLAKVWGFAKYHHSNTCNVDWDELLVSSVGDVLQSQNADEFNVILESLLLSADPVIEIPDTIHPEGIYNVNADFSWIDNSLFSPGVKEKLHEIENQFRPKANCYVKLADFTDPNNSSLLEFNEDPVDVVNFSYAIESHRLLVLFHYWNIIEYFHPDKFLMEQDWDTTLLQFIPLMRSADSQTKFHIQFVRMVHYLHDTHGFTHSLSTDSIFGSRYPFLKLEYIDGQTVVSNSGVAIHDIVVGDIVKEINGIDIQEYRDSMYQYVVGSNLSAENRNLNQLILKGQPNTSINLKLENSTGQLYSSSIVRNATEGAYTNWVYNNSAPAYSLTTCNYGYVNMDKLRSSDVPAMYNALKDAPVIIFDQRNYPDLVIWDLLPYFLPEPTTWSLLGIPELSVPGWYKLFDNKYDAGLFNNPNPYTGRVVILVNAYTQSLAEYTAMGLQTHPNVFVIGSETAGADGDVSYVELPGGLTTYWTSMGLHYPDTISAQGVGVRIDSIVELTIEDIRAGKDPVLQAALDCLSGTNESVEVIDITISPNPASDRVNVSIGENGYKECHLIVTNLLGQEIYTEKDLVSGNNSVDVSNWSTGVYLVSLVDRYGKIRGEKELVITNY